MNYIMLTGIIISESESSSQDISFQLQELDIMGRGNTYQVFYDEALILYGKEMIQKGEIVCVVGEFKADSDDGQLHIQAYDVEVLATPEATKLTQKAREKSRAAWLFGDIPKHDKSKTE